MALTIDQLQVTIEAQSKTASTAIDSLATSLSNLKNMVKGGAGLTTTTNQLTKFSAAINAMSSPALKISALVGALKPLETIGKSNLGSALNQLKKIPQITEGLDDAKLSAFATKINQVTAAVRPLAVEMEKVSQGFSKLPGNMQRAISANERLTKSNKSTAFSFNMMAAKIGIIVMAVRRVGQVIAGWINKSNAYVENLNLFTVAMGEYAKSAQEYAEQVGDLMGIDPSAWMRNQGVFMILETGFGVAADKAALMSQNLTQLGYDLSSFFNISVEDSMQKLQSGMSGELEPLRRLGYDLSQAKLQAIALANGIDKSFISMTQAEKSQLRYYAIMTQVTEAQGDMARTLEAPANQLRIFQAQIVQASRALGNIFIPMLNKVLPYAIAFLQVIRWIANELANLLGFTLPEIDYSNVNTGQIADDLIEGNEAAKELKRTILGFDQLNIMNGATGGTGNTPNPAGDDLNLNLPSYDFIEGLTKSKASEIFAKWKEDITPTIEYIKDNFESIKTLAVATGIILMGWKIGTGVTNVLSSLSSLSTAGMVGGAIGGIAIFFTGIWTAIQNGIDWISTLIIESGAFIGGAFVGALIGAAGGPIGSALGAVAGLWIGLYTSAYIWVFQNLDKIKNLFLSIVGWININVIQPVWGVFSGLFTNIYTWVKQKLADIKAVFLPVVAWFGTLFNSVWMIIRAVWIVVSGWFNTNVIVPIKGFFSSAFTVIKTGFSTAWTFVKGVWGAVSGFFKINILNPLLNIFSPIWEGIKTGFSRAFNWVVDTAKSIFNGLIGVIEKLLNDAIIGGLNKLVGGFNKIAGWAAGVLGEKWGGLSLISNINIPRLAEGGDVNAGQLFIAREAGPEMVGSMGGKTAVANNDQIVEAVSKGVANAVRGAMGGNGEINIYIDGVLEKSISAFERKNTRAGRTVIPVGV